MARIELIALQGRTLSWDKLVETLPAALEAVGLVPDESGRDGEVKIVEHGEGGVILLMDRAALARRVGLSLSTRAGTLIEGFEVVGNSGPKRIRFKTEAWKANAAGELRPAEGKELNLEDPDEQIGELAEQAEQVLVAYARWNTLEVPSQVIGFKKKPAGRPSTPRVSALLKALQQARNHHAEVQPDGRVQLKIELATGSKQMSFCTAAEHAELQKLMG